VGGDVWDYRVTARGEEAPGNQARLNRLGAEGRELVAVAGSAQSHVVLAYLRRRKREVFISESRPEDTGQSTLGTA